MPEDQVECIKQIEEDIKSGKVEIKLDTETGQVEFHQKYEKIFKKLRVFTLSFLILGPGV